MEAKTPALVTVIVLAASCDEDMRDSLDALLRQMHRPLEIILAGEEAPGKWETSAKAAGVGIRTASDTGEGLRCAAGRFIQWLRPGDVSGREKIARQVSHLENSPDTDLIYCTSNDRGLSATTSPPASFCRGAKDYLTALTAQNFIPLSAVLARRSAALALGAFDDSTGFSGAAAWEAWWRGARMGLRFHYQEDVLLHTRRHPRALTTGDEASLVGVRRLLDAMTKALPDDEIITPARRLSLLYAHVVELLDPMQAWEERKGIDFPKNGRRELEKRILNLAEPLLGGGEWLELPGLELRRLEAMLLVGHLKLLAKDRGEGWQAVAVFCEEAKWAFDAGLDPEYTLTLLPLMQRLYEKTLRSGFKAEAHRTQGLMRDLLYQQILVDGSMDDAYRQSLRRLIQEAFDKAGRDGLRRIGLYGGGLHTTRMLIWIDHGLIRTGEAGIIGIVDDDAKKHGNLIHGLPVMSRREMIALSPDAIMLSSDCLEKKLFRRTAPLRRAGIPVLRIYDREKPAE